MSFLDAWLETTLGSVDERGKAMRPMLIEDDMVPEIVAALARRAKYFEGAIENIEANGGDAETVAAWQRAADKLWALIRSLGEEPPVERDQGVETQEAKS